MTLLEGYPNAPAFWQGELPITNRYSFGLAGERFFRTIKDDGRLTGTHCPHCERIYIPALLYCERCLRELNEWVDVGLMGEIYSFTFLYTNQDGTLRDSPQMIAFIRFGDGGLVHHLGEIQPEDIFIGMLVEPVFKPLEARIGSILDIEYFKPHS